MRNNRFTKQSFVDWVMSLNTQTLTDELKADICDEFEAIQYHPDIVLAIDFDHTICISDYPRLGEMREDAAEVIRKLHEEGFGIVINTCREGRALSSAIDWLDENNIPYDYVNCNFPHLIERYNADCRKISADMYIDDKNVEPLPEWKKIYEIIHNKFKKDQNE